MYFGFKRAACVAAVLALTGFGVAHSQAAITDTLDITTNFFGAFPPGSNAEQANANGNGTVSIIRPTSGMDAGINWGPGGSNVPITGNENLTVTPTGAVGSGDWLPSILFFDNTHTYLGEGFWGSARTTTGPETLNIPAFAVTTLGINAPNASEYVLRFRTPDASSGDGFTFTEIDTTAAVSTPEPAALGMLAIGAVALVHRRRA